MWSTRRVVHMSTLTPSLSIRQHRHCRSATRYLQEGGRGEDQLKSPCGADWGIQCAKGRKSMPGGTYHCCLSTSSLPPKDLTFSMSPTFITK